jgi:hypothetical protein
MKSENEIQAKRPHPGRFSLDSLVYDPIWAGIEMIGCHYPNSLVDLSRLGPKSVSAGYLASPVDALCLWCAQLVTPLRAIDASFPIRRSCKFSSTSFKPSIYVF